MTHRERVQTAWDKSGVAVYATLAVLLAAACGFSAGMWSAKSDILALIAAHRTESDKDDQACRADISYLRERLVESKQIIARQSDQLAAAGVSSSQAAIKASDAASKAADAVQTQQAGQ
jgi:cobalamin biosynthesis Mg chelatase CobN